MLTQTVRVKNCFHFVQQFHAQRDYYMFTFRLREKYAVQVFVRRLSCWPYAACWRVQVMLVYILDLVGTPTNPVIANIKIVYVYNIPTIVFKAIVRSYKLPPTFWMSNLSLCTYSGWMSCLFSFVWASPSYEARKERNKKKIKMKIYVSIGNRTSDHIPRWRLRPLGYKLTDDKLFLKVLHNHG